MVSGVAVAFLASTIDLAASGEVIGSSNIGLLAASVAVLALGVGIRIARWQLLIPAQTGLARVRRRRLALPVLVGYLGNLLLPARLGEGVRAASLWRRESIGLPEALGSIAVERVLDTAIIGLLGLAATVWLGAPPWLVAACAVVAVAACAMLAMLLSGVGTSVARRLAAGSRWPRVAIPADRFLHAASVQDRSAVRGAVMLTVIAWALDALIVWLAAAAISIPLDAAGAMAIAAAATLSTAVPAAPGYVGTYELAASAVGTALGLSPASALALAVLVHVITLVPLAIAGLAAAASLGMSFSVGLAPPAVSAASDGSG